MTDSSPSTGGADAIARKMGLASSSSTEFFICTYCPGVKGMAESVTGLLEKAGVIDGRVLTNF